LHDSDFDVLITTMFRCTLCSSLSCIFKKTD